MTVQRFNLYLDDHSGESLVPLHIPLHVPGFNHYCPVCGIGCKSKKEASACCEALAPTDQRRKRIKTGHERRRDSCASS